jgi:hypothetical protein
MQIFKDIYKRYIEEDRFLSNSTLVEITKLIFEAITQINKTESLARNFTIYELRDSNRGDMTLYIYIKNLLLS